jgi:hypothetical protein
LPFAVSSTCVESRPIRDPPCLCGASDHETAPGATRGSGHMTFREILKIYSGNFP